MVMREARGEDVLLVQSPQCKYERTTSSVFVCVVCNSYIHSLLCCSKRRFRFLRLASSAYISVFVLFLFLFIVLGESVSMTVAKKLIHQRKESEVGPNLNLRSDGAKGGGGSGGRGRGTGVAKKTNRSGHRAGKAGSTGKTGRGSRPAAAGKHQRDAHGRSAAAADEVGAAESGHKVQKKDASIGGAGKRAKEHLRRGGSKKRRQRRSRKAKAL